MTVTAKPARNEYTGKAGQTVFNYTFKIYTDQDLDVYVTPAGQDANDANDITTSYVIDPVGIGSKDGGFLTLSTPVNAGDLVTIVSAMANDRLNDYQNSGDFLPDPVNNDFDRSISLDKQTDDKATRTPSYPRSQQNAASQLLDPPTPLGFWRDKSDLSGVEKVDLTSTGSPTDSSVITYDAGNNFLGGVLRTQQDKNRDVVNVHDFGAIGDGLADDTAAFEAAFLGSPARVECRPGDSYLISRLVIPDGCVFSTYGCVFISDNSVGSNNSIIVMGDGIYVDKIILDLGVSNIAARALSVGDDCTIGDIHVYSTNQHTEFDEGIDGIVQIRSNNTVINTVRVDNCDLAITAFGANNTYINYIEINSYYRGIYVRDCDGLTVNHFVAKTVSSSATGGAGENAILFESKAANNSCINNRFNSIDIDGAGEHGIRLGGALAVSDTYLGHAIIRNVGASGIKALGTIGGGQHLRLTIDTPEIYDGGTTSNNHSGILLQQCIDVTIVQPRIMAVNQANSFWHGIRIGGCSRVNIASPTVMDTIQDGVIVQIYLTSDCSDVVLVGGLVKDCATYGLTLDATSGIIRRFSWDGMPTIHNCDIGVQVIGSGTYSNNSLECNLLDNNTQPASISISSIMSNFQGDFISTGAADGSTYQSKAGAFYLRKAGAWAQL